MKQLTMIRGPRSGWGGIPPGGDTGQILAKSSDDDGDVEWIGTGVSIELYGAAGDGETDNTEAIQNAVNAESCIYIPIGTFLVSDRITIAAPITVYGDGYGSVLTTDAGEDFIFLLVQHPSYSAVSGVRMRNFRIDANGSGQLDAGIIQFNNAVGFVCDSVWVENATRASGSSGVNGIAMSSGSLGGAQPRGSIVNCHITRCSKAAINASSETGSLYVAGNIIHTNSGIGQTPGVQIFGGSNVRVIGNEIYNNEGPGIFVATDAFDNGPEYALICGNHIHSNGTGTSQGEGIAVQNARLVTTGRIIISDNHIYNNGANVNAAGILLQNEKRADVSGNYIYSNSGSGIEVDQTTNITGEIRILNNVLENNNQDDFSDGAGIYVDGTIDHLVIRGNKFVDSQSSKTQDWGVRLSASGSIDNFVLEHNEASGLGNPIAYLLGAGMTVKKMRASIDWERETTDGSAVNGPAFTLADNSAVFAKSFVIGMQSDGSNRAGYERTATIYRDGGNATAQGAIAAPYTEESSAGWDSTINIGNLQFAPNVTGAAATTINWRGKFETISV